MRKKFFIVLDNETANSLAKPLPYDFGWVVVDREGRIYKSYSFIIYEIYCKQREMMKSAYYADKIPMYEEEIKSGKRKIVSFWTARKIFFDCCKEFGITDIYAYNMGFDRRALNSGAEFISGWMKWFFPKDVNFKCIWHMACSCILNRKSYINFAEKNNLISAKGNILTNAEACYRYITKDENFKESHTALEDAVIETAIMAFVFKQHKKFDDSVNSGCWHKVQKKRKEIAAALA